MVLPGARGRHASGELPTAIAYAVWRWPVCGADIVYGPMRFQALARGLSVALQREALLTLPSRG
eukprot:2053235-Rhodomonas_salina.1